MILGEKNSFFYLISWKINIEEKTIYELTLNWHNWH
jgi:hypothetical protein